MKVGIAMMSHETNTFSPVVTDLDRFAGGHGVPLQGDAALQIYTGTASCLGGYIDVARQRGAQIDMGIAAGAPPSGPVDDAAYEWMCDEIQNLAGRVDALLLDLHGAMVTQSHDDGEGELLRRLRTQYPDLPIGVALDMHANITEQMVGHCNLIGGYHTYPHIDMDGTARRVAEVFFDMLEGKVNPVMRWDNAPMLPHVMRQGTDDFPNKQLQARAIDMERGEALIASLFTGFPHADIHDAGLSCVIVADGDPAGAGSLVDELLDQAWQDREAFVYQPQTLSESIAHARVAAQAPGNGPVILLDHYDNTASGGTMDTTDVLRAIIEAGLEDVAVFGFYDPAAVQQMVAAGVGNTVTVDLGGKLEMPAIDADPSPLRLTGEVKLLSNGKFTAQVEMARGLTINMGISGVLGLPNGIDVAIISRHIEPYDPECFRSLGMEPTRRRYLMLKSRIHYRVGFKPLAREIVECAGTGVCTSDYSELTFNRVRRPVYPLDTVEPGSNISRAAFSDAAG